MNAQAGTRAKSAMKASVDAHKKSRAPMKAEIEASMENPLKVDTAILGGSFDPVHNGHLHLLECALKMTDIRRIILIPAFQSNFKLDTVSQASPQQRLDMLGLAIGDFKSANPRLLAGREVIIDDLEIRKGGVSYTSDTVRAIIEKHNLESRLGLIVGDDHIERLGEWHDFPYIRDNVVFLIFRRLGIKHDVPEGAHCIFMRNPIYEGSSSEIREGRREEELLPPSVEKYVREHALYN